MGVLTQDDHGDSSFEYEQAWIDREMAWPLSQSMPLSTRTHVGPAVANFLEGLLPDNDEVLERWGRRFQVSPRNPFGLLRHVGRDVAGAAQFIDQDDSAEIERETRLDPVTDAEIADQLRSLRRDPEAWTFPHHDGKFSLAGAQAKFALAQTKTGWAVPIGTEASTHIFKPGIAGLRRSDLNEHLSLEVARELGLTVTRSEMLTFEDQTAYVATRFDRRLDEGKVRRLHQEDFCQALGVSPRRKYQHEGGPSPAQVVDVLRRTMAVRRSQEAVSRFIDALAYNWLILGTDAHGKNYSLTYLGPSVQFSPLYDISSAAAYPDELPIHKLKMAMKVGSEYLWRHIESRHWEALAKDLGLPHRSIGDRILEIGDRTGSAIDVVTSRSHLRALDEQFVDRWAAAVKEIVGNAERRIASAR